jgi:hypothetical protein
MKLRFVICAAVGALSLYLTPLVNAQCTLSSETMVANGANVCIGYDQPEYRNPDIKLGTSVLAPYQGYLGASQIPGDTDATFVNDDYLDATPAGRSTSNPAGTLWNTISYNVTYLASASGWTVASANLKYASTIGQVGYAQIANLAFNELENSGFGEGTHFQAGTFIDGVNISGDTGRDVLTSIDEAIYYIALQGTSHDSHVGSIYKIDGMALSALADSLIGAVKTNITAANASASLDSDIDNVSGALWVFTPTNSANLEEWTFVTTPEGGSALAYLILALGGCLAAAFFARRQASMGNLV